VLVTSSWIGVWGPLFHSECAEDEVATSGAFYLPLGLTNSPYAGRASVNSTSPMNASMGYGSSSGYQTVGGTVANGSVWGGFVLEEMVVDRLSNITELGAGSSVHCSREFAYTLQILLPNVGYEILGPIFDTPWGPEFGTGGYSDVGEPLMYNFTTSPGNSTSLFRQGFNQANAPPVSTCDGPAQTIPVSIHGLTTWISFAWEGRNYSVPTTIPLVEDFSYYFPSDFGTWQVENLSAPGGPGGGWAFSYSPCG